jgi:hypothetical protein
MFFGVFFVFFFGKFHQIPKCDQQFLKYGVKILFNVQFDINVTKSHEFGLNLKQSVIISNFARTSNYPLWKNNVNLDQEYTRYCLVFFLFILVYFGRLCRYNFGIFWFFFLVKMLFNYSIYLYAFLVYFLFTVKINIYFDLILFFGIFCYIFEKLEIFVGPGKKSVR